MSFSFSQDPPSISSIKLQLIFPFKSIFLKKTTKKTPPSKPQQKTPQETRGKEKT